MYGAHLWCMHWVWIYKFSRQVGSYIDVRPMYRQWPRQVHWQAQVSLVLGGTSKHLGCTTSEVGLYIGDEVTKQPTRLVCTPMHHQ